jgi:hypothetical protein
MFIYHVIFVVPATLTGFLNVHLNQYCVFQEDTSNKHFIESVFLTTHDVFNVHMKGKAVHTY